MTDYLKRCIELAAASVARGRFAVGAIIVLGEEEISTGMSSTEIKHAPTAYAEMEAIRTGGSKTSGCTLYSSLDQETMTTWRIPNTMTSCLAI